MKKKDINRIIAEARGWTGECRYVENPKTTSDWHCLECGLNDLDGICTMPDYTDPKNYHLLAEAEREVYGSDYAVEWKQTGVYGRATVVAYIGSASHVFASGLHNEETKARAECLAKTIEARKETG